VTSQSIKVEGVIALPEGESISFNEQKFVYLIINRKQCTEPYPVAKIQQKFTFLITEIDVGSQDEVGSYDEDYDVPETQIAISDYIKPDLVPQGQFTQFWEMLGSHPKGAEVISTYQLPFKTMEEAVEGVTK
jgi:hypothetical protein